MTTHVHLQPKWMSPRRSAITLHQSLPFRMYEGVFRSFRTGRLEQELQMVQLSANMCGYIAILWVSIVSFAAVTFRVASQRVFVFVAYFVMTQSGNFWVHPRTQRHSRAKYLVGVFLEGTRFGTHLLNWGFIGLPHSTLYPLRSWSVVVK
jgi:hypothetical protein